MLITTFNSVQSGSGISGILISSGINNWFVSRSTTITSFGISIALWAKNDAGTPITNGVGAYNNWNMEELNIGNN